MSCVKNVCRLKLAVPGFGSQPLMLTTTLYHLGRLSILKIAQLACSIHDRGLDSNFGGIFWSLEMGCFFRGPGSSPGRTLFLLGGIVILGTFRL